jgi:hypothetical protein
MEPIQINVTIKFDDATQAFLGSLFGGLVKPVGEQTKPVTQQKPAAEQKPAPVALVASKPAEKPAEQPKPVAAAPAAAPAQSSITIDSLRELAMTKMNAHRVEIKQKLTELGTPSITKLDVSKYQEMYDFLKGLE